MFKKVGSAVLGGVLGLLSTTTMAVEFMDAAWAKQACDAWNKNAILTAKLAQMPEDMFDSEGYKWIKNDAGRGYKIITMSRDGCKAPKVQLNIAEKNSKAMCIYGGKLDGKKLNMAVDYYMHATDENWSCMGGEWKEEKKEEKKEERKLVKEPRCGVMGSMMTGKLKFAGPKLEAMKVMDPFASFLKLTGKVAATKTACK